MFIEEVLRTFYVLIWASQVALVVKNPVASTEDIRDVGSIPGSGRSPGGRHSNPLQYFCLGKSHRQRNLVGYSPQDCKESDTAAATEHTCVC